jgi:type VII secretion integral membrane protein EccD
VSAPTRRAEASPRGLTRVTLSGARRRADLVLPSAEPLGLLLPDLVALVATRGDEPGGHQLSLLDGTVLDLGTSLAELRVEDGAIVRLDPVTEAPPVPILHDVADHVADAAAGLTGRWDATALRATATAVAALAAGAAAVLAAPGTGPVVLLVAAGLLLLAGGAVAAVGHRAPGAAVLAAGAAVGLVGAAGLPEPARVPAWAVVAGVAAVAAAATSGHPRSALTGAAALAVPLGAWAGLSAAGLPPVDVAAVLAVLAVVLLGVLPRVAVAASGLAALDDRQVGEEPVTRTAATAALAAAHTGLALACAVTAAAAALAGWTLARVPHPVPVWPVVLAGLLAAALLLRLRAYPLTVEVVVLVAGAAVIGWGLLGAPSAPPWVGVAVGAAVAVVATVLLAARPRPHVRARARQLADLAEGVVVLATVPAAVGVLGVYERLLAAF